MSDEMRDLLDRRMKDAEEIMAKFMWELMEEALMNSPAFFGESEVFDLVEDQDLLDVPLSGRGFGV